MRQPIAQVFARHVHRRADAVVGLGAVRVDAVDEAAVEVVGDVGEGGARVDDGRVLGRLRVHTSRDRLDLHVVVHGARVRQRRPLQRRGVQRRVEAADGEDAARVGQAHRELERVQLARGVQHRHEGLVRAGHAHDAVGALRAEHAALRRVAPEAERHAPHLALGLVRVLVGDPQRVLVVHAAQLRSLCVGLVVAALVAGALRAVQPRRVAPDGAHRARRAHVKLGVHVRAARPAVAAGHGEQR
mmetsp:Transcript_18307/g.64842  ORF Transcript_18307/g.64842 Transcript_18307/m.64842 type:complete len:244 (-) Transcript_18307:311-1042(-)